MTKVKLISCLSMLALSLSMLVMGVLALATQTITLTGEVGFNIADKSIYVKDARISDETITGFMPGYINDGLILSDATISGSSFEISLDVINTTTNNFDIVIETSQSGVSVTTEAYIPANSTDLTEITSSTPITETIVLTVTNSTSSPVDLTNILIKIEERTFAVLDGFVFRSNGTGTGELVSYSGSAEMVDIPDTYSTMEENGETIFIEGDNYTVTAIASGSQSSYAFQNATNMTSVDIPDTVTSIGAYAFYNCTDLTTANVPTSLISIGTCAFYRCSNLSSGLSIPATLRTIGVHAFYSCSSLTSNGLDLSNLTSLGGWAFFQCSSLTGSLTLPSISTIPMRAFSSCSGLTGGITINSGTTTIDDFAFYGCSGLNGTLTLPSTLRTIGDSAFYNCSNLSRNGLNLSNITSLGDGAFSSCSNFTGTLTLPNLSTIPEYAFSNCSFTGTLTIPSSVTTIGDSAFNGNDFSGTLSIPSNVRTIGGSAFTSLSNITRLILSSGITSIGDMAFGYMSNLTSIEYNIPSLADYSSHPSLFVYSGNVSNDIEVAFGSNVTRIPAYLFSNSTSFSSTMSRPRITTVNIPSSVTYIGRYAFRNCSDLTEANFDVTSGWYYTSSSSATTGTTISGLSDPATAAEHLRSNYVNYYWKCNPVTIYEDFVFNNLPSNTGELVSYTGTDTSVEIPSSYSTTVIDGETVFIEGDDYTVTAIADGTISTGAFANSTLTNVVIPNTITRIGNCAFYGTRITTCDLPNSVKEIGALAFSNCRGLTDITIPSSVTKIEERAFSNSMYLTSIYYDAQIVDFTENLSIFSNAGGNTTGITLTIGPNVTRVPSYFLDVGSGSSYSSPNITEVIISEGVEEIGAHAFAGCSSLTTITLPTTLERIEGYAFAETGITSIVIPENVIFIGAYAFSGSSLTSARFENTLGWNVGSLTQPASIIAQMLTEAYVAQDWECII